MSGPSFRADLYRGTASYYDRYRLRYPAALIDDLCRRAALSGTGRLLDLACGPGTVTFALCDRFTEVRAVDLEPETIEFAACKASDLGVHNVQWTVGRAEDVDAREQFELVTIGTAFHRLDRPRVAELAMRWLRPGGHLALVWANTPQQGAEPWQQAINAVVVAWMARLDATDRLPSDFAAQLEVPHSVILESAGFVEVERHEFGLDHVWTIEALIGFVYSTSLLPRPLFGDRVADFEADMRERLTAIEPAGEFLEHASFAYDLARRPLD